MADSSISDSDRGPSSPPPNYSDDDLEGFIQATKLCEPCCIMFGPQENWTPVGEWWDEVHYEHHDSREALCRCVENSECRICIKLLQHVNVRSASIHPLTHKEKMSKKSIALRDHTVKLWFTFYGVYVDFGILGYSYALRLRLYNCAFSQAGITVCAPFTARNAIGVIERLLIKCR